MDRRGIARRLAVTVKVPVLLLPLAAIVLMGVAVLRPSGWAAAAWVLSGTLLVVIGIGLLSGPAHAEHVAARRGRGGRRVHL